MNNSLTNNLFAVQYVIHKLGLLATCLSGFDLISDSRFYQFFLHSLIRMKNFEHSQYIRACTWITQLSPISGDVPWGLHWLVFVFVGMHMSPCLFYMVQIAQHHYDIFILHCAVLAIPNLWVEFHLVYSLVNFSSWGNIAMVAFFASSLS